VSQNRRSPREFGNAFRCDLSGLAGCVSLLGSGRPVQLWKLPSRAGDMPPLLLWTEPRMLLRGGGGYQGDDKCPRLRVRRRDSDG
jgi:hypothetical protein